jgi:hypothetical protein
VTEFVVDTDYLDRFEIHQSAAGRFSKYWIPGEGIDDFNRSTVGQIRVVDTFRPSTPRRDCRLAARTSA